VKKQVPTSSQTHDGGWRLRSSRQLFRSPWFRLRQDELTLPNEDEITYTVIEHDGWALVVPVLDDGRVVMVRIFRHTVQRTLLECPSGGCDGQPPEQAARRELEEETGYVAAELVHLGHFVASSGISNEQYDVYLAPNPRPTGQIAHENTEQIEVELVPLEELRQDVLHGRLEDASSALAILLAAEHIGRAGCAGSAD
jgi:ADP-ribose pyrophosphatase